MLHQFRLANKLNHREFDSLFIGRSDLLRSELGRDDTVVFLDDFVGTGNQAVIAWQNMFQELTAPIGTVYLITVGAFQIGSERIRAETRMQLLAHRSLGYRDNLFHADCNHFTAHEKNRILHYCKLASRDHPCGFGGLWVGNCALSPVPEQLPGGAACPRLRHGTRCSPVVDVGSFPRWQPLASL